MTARADIVVGTRAGVLLLPVTSVFEERGAAIVHVLRDGSIEAVPITVGETDEGVVEILTGLREGDRVLLDAPTSGGGSSAATPAATGMPRRDRASNAANGLQRR
jgi:multidrug efflux pump subunit AcrA (membrane-fusion protein)